MAAGVCLAFEWVVSSSATAISHSSERWVVGAKQRWRQAAALHFEQKTYLVGEWVKQPILPRPIRPISGFVVVVILIW